MIVKHGMTPDTLGLTPYVGKSRVVLAKRMTEDFLIETGKGWEACKKGMWLVSIGSELWSGVEHAQFLRIFRPYDPLNDCIGPCDKERP